MSGAWRQAFLQAQCDRECFTPCPQLAHTRSNQKAPQHAKADRAKRQKQCTRRLSVWHDVFDVIHRGTLGPGGHGQLCEGLQMLGVNLQKAMVVSGRGME